MSLTKSQRRQRIKFRVRKIVNGSSTKPRLSVFRSNREIYAQLINDIDGRTLAVASSREKDIANMKGTNVEIANAVGKLVGERAIKVGIENIAFDRGGYLYHGRVRSLAEGARAAGLKF